MDEDVCPRPYSLGLDVSGRWPFEMGVAGCPRPCSLGLYVSGRWPFEIGVVDAPGLAAWA